MLRCYQEKGGAKFWSQIRDKRHRPESDSCHSYRDPTFNSSTEWAHHTPPITPVEDLPVLAPSQRESQSSAIAPPIAQTPPAESFSKYKFNLNCLRACIEGDLEYVKKELADRPQSLECRDWVGNSPLEIAAKSGQNKIVKLLMDKGCNIHGMNLDRNTPLLDAADNGHLEVVKILLSAGVNPSQTNAKNQKPFDRVKGDSKRAYAIRMALIVAEERWACVTDAAPQKLERQRERPLSDLSVGKRMEARNRGGECDEILYAQ